MQILAIYVYLIWGGQLEQMKTNTSTYDLFPWNLRFAKTLIEHCDDWLSWSTKPVASHVVSEHISFHLAPEPERFRLHLYISSHSGHSSSIPSSY